MGTASSRPQAPDGLELRLLGPLLVLRSGVAQPLPASRKVRALIGYLALAPRSVSRAHLCELLWDVPNDPRGELRWCLSKLRALIDTPARCRVRADRERVELALEPEAVDALALERACDSGLDRLSVEQLRALLPARNAELLEGSEVDSPAFDVWLVGQRRRLREQQAQLLEALAARGPEHARLDYLERWRELAPLQPRAHVALLGALIQRGQLREAEEHLASACRAFEASALDAGELREAWRALRASVPSAAVSVSLPSAAADGGSMLGARRASIAVMPFSEHGLSAAQAGELGDALAHDVITGLAQLRSLFVIAHATMFTLHGRGTTGDQAARLLGVDYLVNGSVRVRAARLRVQVELVEASSARIVWTEGFELATADASQLPAEIGQRIVAAIAGEVDLREQGRALLRPPEQLDAWQAHQRGVWHMYRFSRADNALARQLFERAIALDPTFARAHAGLSFTHFQDGFQGWAERRAATERAHAAALQGLALDERDPAGHVALGRSLWLQDRTEPALVSLAQAAELSPSFALAHYMLAFIQAQVGDAQRAVHAADLSQRLSPYDPMLFGMLGSRAVALVRLGRHADAAEWAVQAAARPNAHAHIRAIAVYSLALAGSLPEARAQALLLQRERPGYAIDDFLATFRFDPQTAAAFRAAALQL